ncbi:MAG TPA: aminotransferase class I/II-fold pyridoxal phosphate-dependent enzyme [Candidatus Sulfotelmatobacter sp.]|nr:aminotransferase class I/II-fold pyridoxal phosphate-dependent enzyme [Candidatus Sulfotelmatobacter sp.]
MTGEGGIFGLTAQAKARLLEKLATHRISRGAAAEARKAGAAELQDDFESLQGYREMRMIRAAGEALGIGNPYFRVHDAIAGAETSIGNKTYLNFSSYNYVGLNGDPRVSAAAKAAIDRYGTSVSASRLVSGERGIHRELEQALAEVYSAEDCIAFVSGHATNVTVIGNLCGPQDVVLHDTLIHNSVLQGALLSGATRVAFPHNDPKAAERLLAGIRSRHRRAMVVIEGHYSMDGDAPDLAAFVALARRHRAWLLVDEAHAIGVLGQHGLGIAERCGVDPREVDLWMGTLSKSLASCGGYIAGRRSLVEYLKFSAPGFVYSVGMTPANAAAALEALRILRQEPERVAKLNANATLFRDRAKAAGLDTGPSVGASIVPIITGGSIRAGRLSEALFRRGMNVQPILYPAVPEPLSRLRFFLSSLHSEEQILSAVEILADENARVGTEESGLMTLSKLLGVGAKG